MNFLLPKETPRTPVIERVTKVLSMLDSGKAWEVRIEPHKPKRTTDQNSLLWSIYTDILERGGEAMAGYTKEDLHEFFLCSHFGEQVVEVFGRKRRVPKHRSRNLNKKDFSDFVESIVRFMAGRGVVLQMPGDL